MLQPSTSYRKERARRQKHAEPTPFDPLKKYLSEIANHPVLSREEEAEIAEKAHRYKDVAASQKLVTSNLRLVVKIALEYQNTCHSLLDLIQEGNIGLVHAVRKYNPYKGTRFSTYSSFWVRAYILKYIMDSWSMVKVGTTQNQRRLFYGLNKEKRKLADMGVFPAPHLLATTFGVKVGDIEDMEKRLSYTDVSLQNPINREGEETFIDTIRMDDNIEEVVSAKEQRKILEEKVLKFKKKLKKRELFIFEQRIMTEEPKTLEAIGALFGISRERVRQVEKGVVSKLDQEFRQEFKHFTSA
ncbi:MAG: RNA polymerase sigma factor RpoH [Syntrophorhabdaceae bacterium PtaU1.Bin034]|jgi:RNA polymerase sigma-32 factor|nr:MAG: RNA polymerase sigma factor RpoH [Syntrophorhabdaceae bacterium PtaU1.Bin034]